jgi:hypothetical protein
MRSQPGQVQTARRAEVVGTTMGSTQPWTPEPSHGLSVPGGAATDAVGTLTTARR